MRSAAIGAERLWPAPRQAVVAYSPDYHPCSALGFTKAEPREGDNLNQGRIVVAMMLDGERVSRWSSVRIGRERAVNVPITHVRPGFGDFNLFPYSVANTPPLDRFARDAAPAEARGGQGLASCQKSGKRELKT